jgi:hypothetical protein
LFFTGDSRDFDGGEENLSSVTGATATFVPKVSWYLSASNTLQSATAIMMVDNTGSVPIVVTGQSRAHYATTTNPRSATYALGVSIPAAPNTAQPSIGSGHGYGPDQQSAYTAQVKDNIRGSTAAGIGFSMTAAQLALQTASAMPGLVGSDLQSGLNAVAGADFLPHMIASNDQVPGHMVMDALSGVGNIADHITRILPKIANTASAVADYATKIVNVGERLAPVFQSVGNAFDDIF